MADNPHRSIVRRVFGRVLGLLAQVLPGATTLRPFLHRLRGLRIERHVFIGDQVYLENEFPQCIEIREGASVCLRTVVMAHLNWEPGKVVIGRNAWIGPNCFVFAPPGRTLTIGDGAVIAACTCVTSNVEAGTFVTGPKASAVARATVPLTRDRSYYDFLRGVVPFDPPEAEPGPQGPSGTGR
jgi:serine acetyltransferase